jgi:hypothetical protein
MANPIKRSIRKIVSKVPTEENKKLKEWKSKFDRAKSAYEPELKRMERDQSYYDGDRSVMGNPNSSRPSNKVATNVRNIVYELVETQVDSSIPYPKVTAIHPEDEELAKVIEALLINEIKRLKFPILNDVQERNTPVLGGDFFQVEWDKDAGFHCTVGDLSVSERNPKLIIPQAGVTNIDEMDYIFVRTTQTKEYVKKKYGVDVSDAKEEDFSIRNGENDGLVEDLVTVNVAYYKNSKGIGCFVWCDDIVLLDIEDYQARRTEKCKKCGHVRANDEKECPVCGSKKWENTPDEYEEMADTMTLRSGEIIDPMMEVENMVLDPEGNPMLDDMTGMPFTSIEYEKKKIPYYKPNCLPIVRRVNVSRDGYFLGYSDAEVIRDQQDRVKKYGSKIDEKLLKGGSFVSLPEGVGVETNGEELNIIRLQNPAQKQLIDVFNIQADIGNDLTVMSQNYEWARSTLGVTDAFQGKYDASARSGTAKQFSINQAAGRLESKRVLKNEFYSTLYKMMFQFLLAYSDQKIPVTAEGQDGNTNYIHFDRYDFLKVDPAGEFYWNDEFLFETDPTSSMMANREAMWDANDMKLQSGAFGQLGDLDTALLYWKLQEKSNYPNAGIIRASIEEKIQKQEMEMQQAQQMQMMAQGGMGNGMPGM